VAALDALSPLRVLGRGYAIALRSDGRALRYASDVQVGDTIELRVAQARISAQVGSVEADAATSERTEGAKEHA
jgi:exodeoxyribonuclease VII large subunit